MKTNAKWRLGLMAALAVLGTLTATKARAVATTTAYLNIDVTITSALSEKVDNLASSTYTLTWNGTANQKFVNDGGADPSSATVTNDTGILNERWLLATNAASINTAGNASTWAPSASSTTIGADKFALQAVFGSSNTLSNGCLGSGAGTWDNSTAAPLLSTAQLMYTSTQLTGSTLTNNGGLAVPDNGANRIFGGDKRVLCWRLIMPDSTSTTDTQNVQILVTATP